ncbi:MFS transporter [Pyxidicoccus parkwayensis]|uniref:MFS transporter n=1 Tax=Pyxidicoccus parkwayensis TaxID=2813578 RepID=A0ABX7P9E6_9BACT|nr:MFS transporter [Pyxidicoccus parkwaysis]QSQ27086.1 MFS transporter [Pyxidicoccus parkwaysis]
MSGQHEAATASGAIQSGGDGRIHLEAGAVRALPRSGGWVVATSMLGLMLGYSTYISYVFGVFVRPLGAEFGWNRPQIAFALTLCNWFVVALSPLAGFLLDRVGPRRMLLPSVVGLAGMLFALAFQPGSLPVFYALHLGLALAALGTLPAVYTRAIVGWFDARRGIALGIALAGVGLGGIVLPPALQGAIGALGWRGAYGALGGAMLVLVLPAAFRFFDDAASAPVSAAVPVPTHGVANLREAARTRTFWLLMGIFVLLGTMTLGISASLVPILTDFGLSPQGAAAMASSLGVGVLVGRVASGLLIDRLPARLVALACLLASSAGLAGLSRGGADTGPLIAVCLFLAGFGIGAEFDFMSWFVSRYLGLRAYGRIYGWTYAAFQLGCGLGPLLMALVRERSGGYGPGLLGLSAAAALAGLLFLAFPPLAQGTKREASK